MNDRTPEEPPGDDYHEEDFDQAVQAGEELLPTPPPDSLESYSSYDVSDVLPEPPFSVSTEEPAFVLGTLTDDDGNVLPSFDEKYQEDFYGLLHLGALAKRFTWLGHRFSIRTLTTEEVLYIAMLTKEYGGTAADMVAYRTAVVAMCTQTVDGKELPVPIGNDTNYEWAQQRFTYCKRWFQPTIEKIFGEYLDVELRVRQVMDAMGKAYGHQPLVDSTPG